MAKGSRNKTNKVKDQLTVSASASNSASNKIGSALAAVDNLVKDDNGLVLGAMAEKLKFAKKSYDVAEEEKKRQASESFGSEIEALVGELKKLIEDNKRLEAENRQSASRSKQLEESVENLKKKINFDKKELDKQSEELHFSQKKNAADKADIAKRLEALKEQELDAETGFATKHMEMLESFEEKQNSLRESLEQKKSKLVLEINQLIQAKQSLSEEQTSLFEERLQALSSKEMELDEKAFQLKKEKTLAERKLKQAQLTEEESESYKNALKEEVEKGFTHQIKSLENQKTMLEAQLIKYDESEKQLLSKLSSFVELEQQFADASPQQVLEQLSSYKQMVKQLSMQLDEKPSEQLEQNYKVLKKSYEEMEQSYRNSQTKLRQMETQLSKSAMSVIELEHAEKRKQVYEKHNQLLKAAVDQLGADVDELVNKKQAKSAFPALWELDEELRSKGLTESVPSLKLFAEELQQRIAWDPEEKKALYYCLEDVSLFIAGLAMSRLHILQGISGTGKTSLPIAFARAIGGGVKRISVHAGWRDKGDLIGHFNAFEKKFYEMETLKALYEAQCPEYSDRPYIILLDEMNLSRPEQYFADFISKLEFDPKDRILELMPKGQPNGPKMLIDGSKIKIPENIWFIGTANRDETTFEFADKTYDRAHVMELPRHKAIFPIDKHLEQIIYSFDSLEAAFNVAAKKHKNRVLKLIEDMGNSAFSVRLDEDFDVSWGNRLERHLFRFIPVMIECGSDLGFALDHMIATKLLREGKATGRYDTDKDDIKNLRKEIVEFWDSQGFQTDPIACLKLLDKEKKKK